MWFGDTVRSARRILLRRRSRRSRSYTGLSRRMGSASSATTAVFPRLIQPSTALYSATIGKGELTPDEGNQIGALIERRANLFHTVELQDEIATLKAQMLALAPRQQSMLRVVE